MSKLFGDPLSLSEDEKAFQKSSKELKILSKLEKAKAELAREEEALAKLEKAQSEIDEIERKKAEVAKKKSTLKETDELVVEKKAEVQSDPEKVKDVFTFFVQKIGPMNILLYLVYSILLLVAFIWFKPWFIYDYPTAETQNQCVLQYCLGGLCYDLTGQEINDSIKEGMRSLNWYKAIGYYFGILLVIIIVHFLIAKVGILNIGTNSGRCYYKPLYC